MGAITTLNILDGVLPRFPSSENALLFTSTTNKLQCHPYILHVKLVMLLVGKLMLLKLLG